MIKEELLHFVWRTHRIPKIGMRTTEGENVEILSPGVLNHNDGPDFTNAKIRIGELLWVGPIEIHVKSSDWYAHNHQSDSRYDAVVLHVVLEENQPVEVLNRRLPCLEIKRFVTQALQHTYSDLQKCKENLACAPYDLPQMNESFLWMRDRLIIERLQRRLSITSSPTKASQILFYTLLFGALGAKSNRESFEELASRIQWAQIDRWLQRPERIYTYIMYTSGLFEKELSTMPELKLIEAYVEQPMPKSCWQNKQIRPAARPKIRILEICSILAKQAFVPLIEADDVFEYNEAWNNLLDEIRSGSFDQIKYGDFVLSNIALNAIVPYAYFRGVQSGNSAWFDFALQHLEDWPPEQNKIIKLYRNKGLKISSGGDSQALLELYQSYCIPKKCVSCAIGMTLLRA